MHHPKIFLLLATLLLVTLLSALDPPRGHADGPSTGPEETKLVRDDKGRIIRKIEKNNVTEYILNSSGRKTAIRSTRYGTTELFYAPGGVGPVARVRSHKHLGPLGPWERHTIYDPVGHPALNLNGIQQKQLRQIVERLQPYFWPEGLPKPLTIENLDPIQGKGFASIDVQRLGGGSRIQRTTVFGRSMEIRTEWTDDGDRREIRDDAGGHRTEISFNKTLMEVHDQFGPILETQVDPYGRANGIIVGGKTLLAYEFDRYTARWAAKHLRRWADDEPLGSWKRADDFETPEDAAKPQRAALAFLPGSIPIAQWDDAFQQDGVIMITHSGDPYALLSFDGDGEIWRSVTTRFRGPHITDRIDYTASKIRLHISLGSSSLAARSKAIVVVELDREVLPPEARV